MRIFLYVLVFIQLYSFSNPACQDNAETIIQLRNHSTRFPPIDPDQNVKHNQKILEKSRGFLFWRNADLRTFGVWVEAEGPVQPLNNPRELDRLLDIIYEYPVSDIYVQVYRNGRSWFPSSFADATPYNTIKSLGRDPLSEIIGAARKKKEPARVHAWFNALRLGEDQKAKVFSYLGTDATLVSTRGESLYDTKGQGVVGCRPDTPGIWIDAHNQKVKELLVHVFKELMQAYPHVEGLHLDMIRTPFPYAPNELRAENCTAFVSPTHLSSVQNANTERYEEAYENTGTTQLVKHVRDVIDDSYDHVQLSAAVLSNQKKAIDSAQQPWPLWVEKGYVDHIVTMNYTDNMERFERELLQAKELGEDKVSIGVGAWLAQNNPEVLKNQILLTKEHRMKGVVLFSHGNLALDSANQLYNLTRDMLIRD